MSEFVIKKQTKERERVVIRVESQILDIIDAKAKEADISRSEAINQMIMYALSNMKQD